MLSRIQYLVEGVFQSSSRVFHRAGLSPNSLTALGFSLWIVASILYWGGLSGWEWGATIVVLLVAGNRSLCRASCRSSRNVLAGAVGYVGSFDGQLRQGTSRGRGRDAEGNRDRGTTRKTSDSCVRDLALATLSWISFLGGLVDRSTVFDYFGR